MQTQGACKRCPGTRWALALAVALFLAGMPARAGAEGPIETRGNTAAPHLFLPLVAIAHNVCPSSSTARFGAIVPSASLETTPRPAALHADLNLALRGYEAVREPLTLLTYGSTKPPDTLAPQLTGLLSNAAVQFTGTYAVNSWDWNCGEALGCRGAPITDWPVTLLGLRTTRGQLVHVPATSRLIDAAHAYVALVLYADRERITLKYTLEPDVTGGYTVHLEDVCVDPQLLAMYQNLDGAGRRQLPALRSGEVLGTARDTAIKVAVRDTGRFMDPRSRLDWWQGR